MRERASIVLRVARDPTLARIQLAFLGFNMAEDGTWVAILVYAYAIGGAGTAGLFALAQLLPAAIVAPLAANAGDRFRKERVLVAGYLLQGISLAATAVALFTAAPVPLTLGVAIVASVSLTLTRPTQAVLLPALTHSAADLTAANAVSSLAQNVGILVGPFVSGLLLAQSGPAAVFALFAAVSIGSAALVARLPVDPTSEDRPALSGRSIVSESFGGFRELSRERPTLLLVAILASGTIVWGSLDILFVAVAFDLLHAGGAWAGYLTSAFGFGGIVGAFATVSLVGRRRLTPSLGASAGLFGFPILGLGLIPAPISAPVLLGVSGAGSSIAVVAGRTLLQRTAPEALLARVFGLLEGLDMLALAIGSILSALIVTTLGVLGALAVTGAFLPLVIVLTWVRLRVLDRDAKAPDAEALRTLRRLPIFAPLSAPAMERILADLRWLERPAGAALIREGEAGDRFYVLAEGEVEVTQNGRRLNVRGPGDYFGEIALLRDVPRTASITALTEVRLIAIDRDTFLDAVTGHPRSREHAEAAASARLSGVDPAS